MSGLALLLFFPSSAIKADSESVHNTTLLRPPSSTHHTAHNKATTTAIFPSLPLFINNLLISWINYITYDLENKGLRHLITRNMNTN